MEHDGLNALRVFIKRCEDLVKKRGKVTEAEMVKLAEKCWGKNQADKEGLCKLT